MKSLNDFGELLQEHNRAVELALMLPEFIVTSDSGDQNNPYPIPDNWDLMTNHERYSEVSLWCSANGYTGLFAQGNDWYAFPDQAVIPVMVMTTHRS